MEEMATRESVLRYVAENYGVDPDFPWMDMPDACVLRRQDNRKWFAVIMQVAKKRLKIGGEEAVDVMNVKIDPVMVPSLVQKAGYLPAYHMSKEKWISILLDGSLSLNEVAFWIDGSFTLTANKVRRGKAQA